MSLATPMLHLPKAVETKLRDIRRKQVRWAIVETLSATVTVFVGALTLALLIDWIWQLRDTTMRCAISAVVWGVTLGLALRWSWQQWRLLRQPLLAATLADQQIPQLEERWSTVVALAQTPHRPTHPLAISMWQQVTQEAVVLSRLVQPETIASPQAARSAIAICLVSCLPLVLWMAGNMSETSILLQRFLRPLAQITASQLTSHPGDQIVPRGESLELTAHLTGVPRPQARLLLQREDQRLDEITLSPQATDARVFLHGLRVDQSFRYKFQSGDGETPWHAVTAIDAPALAEVRFRIDPPRYSQRSLLEKTHLPQRVKVLAGSRLQWLFRPSMPVSQCELVWTPLPLEPEALPRQPVKQRLKPQADGWYLYEADLLADGTLQLHMQNVQGLTEEEPLVCRIQVLADQTPVARILGNPDEAVVADDETLKIDFEAHDDLGVASAQLVVYDESGVERGEPPRILHVQDIPLGDQLLQKHVLSSVELDLKQLNLPPGSQISYAIRVMDNREGQIEPHRDIANTLAAQPEESPESSKSEMASKDAPRPPSTNTAGDQKPVSAASSEQGANGEHASDEGTPSAESLAAHVTEGPISALFPANRAIEPKLNPATHASQAISALFPENLFTPTPPGEVGTKSLAAAETPRAPGTSSAMADQPRGPDESDGNEATSAKAPALTSESPGTEGQPAGNSKSSKSSSSNTAGGTNPPPPPEARLLAGQSSESVETQRRKLRITERLTAVAAAKEAPVESANLREKVVQIDALLGATEAGLLRIIDRQIPDSERPRQLQQIDEQLGQVEHAIADLRTETRESPFAFVGLQMVDIARTHVTPARERVFIAQRESQVELGRNVTHALQAVLRARELLAALLIRYDRAQQEEKLAKSIEEAGKLYEVYVERSQMLLREAQQNRHPLERKMEFIEVDQDYLDRYAEVLRLRREMLDEFARLLGDDPRLLSRYLELTKRRRASLREQLARISDQQQEMTDEVAGWIQVADAQRSALLALLIEARWEWAGELAKDSAALAEHMEKQLPLVLDATQGPARELVQDARSLATVAREIALDARQQLRDPTADVPWQARADRFLQLSRQVESDLDRLSFNHEDQEEVLDYVTTRLPEVRVVTDQAVRWQKVIAAYLQSRYPALAELDQQQLALTTELLRVEMLDIPTDLQNEFNRQAATSIPEDILAIVSQLQMTMESVTFTQQAATFALSNQQVAIAAEQQQKAIEYLQQAEALFDTMRRKVVEVLDELPVDNPNIADLRDPTLDEFLAQLEREPNIEALLGIPNRRRNLRTYADNLEASSSGSMLLQQAGDAARSRARQTLRETPPPSGASPKELTEEERQQQELAEKQQQELAEALTRIQEKLEDPQLTAGQKEQLEQIEKQMQQALKDAKDSPTGQRRWQQLTEADQAQAALQSLARGQRIPDDQWNKILSTLGDGLWQVGGRSPPEDYRHAIEHYQSRLRDLLESTPSDK